MILEPKSKLIDLKSSATGPRMKAFFQVMGSPIEELFAFEDINQIYRGVQREYLKDHKFFSACARSMNLSVCVEGQGFARIPKAGGLLIVANHPFGALDAIVLGDALANVRSDVKVMANSLLAKMPETSGEVISVNPFGGEGSARQNFSGMKEALKWLAAGHVLVVFPAGEVSHYHLSKHRVTDPEWSDHIGHLAIKAEVPVLPVYFHGRNSVLFQLSGLVHPRLRTLLLAREVVQQQKSMIHLTVGKVLSQETWKHLNSAYEVKRYLRSATYMLSHFESPSAGQRLKGNYQSPVEIVAQDVGFRSELQAAGEKDVIVSQREYQVWLCSAETYPETLKEIGRLREISFRQVGEGSGKECDLDRFDRYYRHLILFDRERGEIMGGYRLGLTDEIIAKYGIQGLYSASLFKLKPALFKYTGAAIELGRSFVVPEHQRSYSALSLLWRGIGAFVVRQPRYAHLFGPVSISADYHPLSQNLMIQYLKHNAYDKQMGREVKPKNPPRYRKLRSTELAEASGLLEEVDGVSALVSYLEHDDKGVPVLLRQYLKMNARLLSFNVDMDFAGVLDGLMISDLRTVERPLLNRFLGAEGAASFLDYHLDSSSD